MSRTDISSPDKFLLKYRVGIKVIIAEVDRKTETEVHAIVCSSAIEEQVLL